MKHKELKGLAPQELKAKLAEVQKELLKLQAQVATGTALKNPGQVGATKKMIATLKMIIHHKEMEKQTRGTEKQ